MINITSARGKQKARVEILRAMTLLEASGARDIRPILNRQFLSAARSVAVGSYNVNAAVNSQRGKMIVTFKRNYRRAATVFNQMAMGKLGAVGAVAEESIPEIKGSREEFWSALNKSINKDTAKRVTNVGKTTKKRIQNVIRRGMESKLSNREIAKNLTGISAIANPKRAKMIARTETHGAAIQAIDESVKTAGVKTTKDWIGANDARSRDIPGRGRIHVEATATQKKISDDKPFIVGGEKLMYPGDFAGSSWNVINCRCAVIYDVVKRITEPSRAPERVGPAPTGLPAAEPKSTWKWRKSVKGVEDAIEKDLKKFDVSVSLRTVDPEFGAMDLEGANIVANELTILAKRHPDIIKSLNQAVYASPKTAGFPMRLDAYAWYDDGSMYFHPKHWSAKQFKNFQRNLKSAQMGRWHPSARVGHVVSHESGHELFAKVFSDKDRMRVREYYINLVKQDKTSALWSKDDYWMRMRKMMKGNRSARLDSAISKYAEENTKEFFCEAFVRYRDETVKATWVRDMLTDVGLKPRLFKPKDIVKAKRAIETYKPATKAVQDVGLKNEGRLAKLVRRAKKQGDNEPFDVIIGRCSRPKDLIEVKTIVRGKNPKITMHKDSLARKWAKAKQHKNARVHTVVFHEGTGKIYYRNHLGSFRLSTMQEVTEAELKAILERVL